MRVIVDLVLNHTSDQHAWFQGPENLPGRPDATLLRLERDGPEVWQARIIFVDTEKSNWTWDPEAQQYYWHRFFSHQPDLNYDNPEVRKAMLEVMDFWLDQGLDGFRCDAVPYLFEREGTMCENLPETHRVFERDSKADRSAVQGTNLLAEANQWPSRRPSLFRRRQ